MKTGIYIRVSSEDQAKEGFSIPAQKEKLIQFCDIKDWTINGIYIEEGISGKNIKDRPQLLTLIDDIKNKTINNILVYKLDRLTRSTKDLIDIVDFLKDEGCEFNSFSEQIDTTSATGRMFLKFLGVIAEMERETIAERVAFGYEQKAREGNYLNTQGVYGYDYKEGSLYINDSERIIVNEIFDNYLKGWSYHRIARDLNKRSIPTKRGGQWRAGTIKSIINNSTYIGKIRYGLHNKNKFFETNGKHESIVDEKKFIEVQKEVESRKGFATKKYTSEDVIFGEVLVCGLCGRRLSTNKSMSSGKYYIKHRCYGVHEGMCDASGVSQNKLEREFINILKDIDLSKVDVEMPNENHDILEKINMYKNENNILNSKKKKAQKLLLNEVLSTDDYKEIIKDIEESIKDNDKKIATLENKLNNDKLSIEEIKQINDIILNIKPVWDILPNVKKKEFVRKFIKELIVLNKNGKYQLDIKFNNN